MVYRPLKLLETWLASYHGMKVAQGCLALARKLPYLLLAKVAELADGQTRSVPDTTTLEY
jgi:hypothetical protein